MLEKICKAELSDLQDIAALESEIFFDAWSLKSLEETWYQKNAVIFAAKTEEKIAGYLIIYYVLDEGEIARIATAPSMRRQGAAGQMFQELVAFCEELSETLERQIPKQKQEDAKYLTIRGRRHIEDKFRNMLKETKERVYLSVSASVLDLFREELLGLVAQKKKVVLLTDEEYSMDGAIIYRTKKFENLSGSADCEGDADGQLRLITDSNYALTGELQDKETSTCLYSANPNLVRLLKDALANEIRLIEIEKKDASI